MMRRLILLLAVVWLAPAQDPFPATITVDAGKNIGENTPVWSYFGYDEPNYTTMPYGRKLLSQLAELSPVPVYVRAHCLLNSGDGTAALKWGSTNVYTEDSNGNPVYDWSILDEILDTWVERGMKPLFEIGFMPEALTSSGMEYRHRFSLEPLHRDIHGAWAYPPKDYEKWAELVFQLVTHCVERYGPKEVETWLWEPWNEPNIHYWRGTQEEYFKLYDYSAEAVKRALPTAQFGGPHTAGAPVEWLQAFFDHVATGENFKTGSAGSPLDFVVFHAKGRPEVAGDHVRMGLGRQLSVVNAGFELIASRPELKGKPVIIGEWDPEGCAACSSRVYPHNDYRNGTMYSSYTAAALAATRALAERHGVNLQGALTWAFEFEDQPWFDGFRALATNGIEKPVLNTFRMFGLMRGDRVAAASTHDAAVDTVIRDGVRGAPQVAAEATRRDGEISVMVWHYHDDDLPGPDAAVALEVNGLPDGGRRILARHYRIDEDHSNPYAAWKRMGSPQTVTAAQRESLEAAAALTPLESPRWIDTTDGTATLEFSLPRQGVSLVQLSW